MDFNDLLENTPKNLNIYNSLLKGRAMLERHSKIAVSVLGGSDSDTIMDLLELVKPENCNLTYVFFDTGLEFDATKRHLEELESKYGVTIERRRAKVTVAAACNKYGVPFISKDASQMLNRLQAHGFDWHDSIENATTEKYGRCKSALDWYFDQRPLTRNGKSMYSISKYSMLHDFIISNPPDFNRLSAIIASV